MRTNRRARAVRSIAVVAAVSVAMAACSPSDSPPVASGDDTVVALSGSAPTLLRQGQSCDQVLEDFKAFAPGVWRSTVGFAADDSVGGAVQADSLAAGEATTPDAAAPRAPAGDTATSSQTNTQEEGIDEPDLVETDGNDVYLVDQDQLVILDAATAAVVSRTPLAGFGAQLLLSGDRLLAISGGYGYGYGYAGPGMAVDDVAVSSVPAAGATDASEPAPPPDGGPAVDPMPVFQGGTTIQLFDVSDPTRPVEIQTAEVEGQHVSTRVVDGVARVVVATYPQPQPLMEAQRSAFTGAPDPARLDVAIDAGVAATTIEDWLPSYRITSPGRDGTTEVPAEGPLVDCADVLVPEVNAGVTETSVLRVDFTDGFDPADTTTVVADPGVVYASTSTLYLAATRYVTPDARAGVAVDDWSTAVHAFALGGDGPAAHLAAGEVRGSVLNQYSLSEYDGLLRIAVTDGTPWGQAADSESAVHVLRIDGDRLTEVGSVGGLGRSETIQSVRFLGPTAYVVTFRQTDPLYVIDLSDPTAPRPVGELKIPGFSSYLHPVGDGRLVGIGRDADANGQDTGLKVSLFDVSDPTAPAEVQTYTERDAYSAAGNDPKAFLWWAPTSDLVVPVERYAPPTGGPVGAPDGAGSISSGTDPVAEGVVGMAVLSVTDGGITPAATVTAGGRYPSRALVVDGRLWSLFDGAVVVSDFADPSGGTLHVLR